MCQLVFEAVKNLDLIVKNPAPVVTLAELQDSNVRFDVYAWVDDPAKGIAGLDAVNEVIWNTLTDNGMIP